MATGNEAELPGMLFIHSQALSSQFAHSHSVATFLAQSHVSGLDVQAQGLFSDRDLFGDTSRTSISLGNIIDVLRLCVIGHLE
jgi:hypothetical protein